MQPPTSTDAPDAPRSERAVVLLVAAVQFVNILDFMIVMPLGPDFARALGIPASHLGVIGGSYTAAACATGLLGSVVLDRFDRRVALGVAMLGLVLGTAMGGLASGLGSLVAARVVAGAFGGPATSLSLSIIADVIPSSRRGKALGVVMSAFSLASVLGVPVALEIALRLGWRAPFFAVAGMGAIIAALGVALLPPLRGHLERPRAAPSGDASPMLTREPVVVSLAMTVAANMGMFLLIPNISAYVQHNLGFPRAQIGTLYFAGGVVSFAVLQLAGRLVDRYGPTRVALPGTAFTALVVWAGFVSVPPPVPLLAVFVGFMASTGFRNVAYNTITSRVPRADERARFMSVQSAVQHASAAAGAFLSSKLLHEGAGGRLVGMPLVAWSTIALAALLPLLMGRVEALTAKPTG